MFPLNQMKLERYTVVIQVGADVVSLLQSAINRQHGPKIEVVVLV